MAGYFPNAYNYDPEDIKKKLSAPRMDRSKLTTYTLPSGATVRMPTGAALPSGYSQAQNQVAGRLNAPFYSDVPQTSVNAGQSYYGGAQTVTSQPNLAQEWMQGYGAPTPPAPQIVSGAGGNYLSKGGVMNPIENVPSNSPYSTFGGNLQKTGVGRLLYGLGTGIGSAASGIGTFAANLFNQGRNQGASYMPNYNSTGFMPPPSQAVQNYQQTGSFGGYANRGPNRYFDY